MKRPTAGSTGFSLVELLVVMVILALLMALLLAAAQKVRATARSIQCRSNLHNLSVAYQHLASKTGKSAPIESVRAWVGSLMPYCDESEAVFRCPEDPDFRNYASAPDGMTAKGRVEYHPEGPPPSLVKHAVADDSFARLYLEKKDFVLPVDLPVDIAQPGTYFGQNDFASGTVPRGTTVDCYLYHTDSVNTLAGNSHPEGQYRCSFGFTGRVLGMMHVDGSRSGHLESSDAIFGKPGTNYDTAWRGLEDDYVMLSSDRHWVNTKNWVGYAIDQIRIITSPGTPVLDSSFGINGRANRLVSNCDKVLLLDYHTIVADVVGSTPQAWGDMLGASPRDSWSLGVAPRHTGMVNVLFADGHIQTMSPGAVDPRVITIHNSMWSPAGDPPLTSDMWDEP